MNRPLPVIIGLGILCCCSGEVVAQERSPQLPEIFPLPQPDPPEIPLPSTPSAPDIDINPFQIPSGVDPKTDPSKTIQVGQFAFKGNTLFTDEQLLNSVRDYLEKPVGVNELFEIEQKITELYVSNGYITSGGFIVSTGIPTGEDQAAITIQIVEGQISEVQITGGKRLHRYIRGKLKPATNKVLHEEELLDALRWLQLSSLIDGLSVQLKPGTIAGDAILSLDVDPAKPLRAEVFLNNSGSPSVGTFERGASVAHTNVTGRGDAVSLTFSNTKGSNGIGWNYSIPINAKDGTISVSFLYGDSDVTERPFDQLNIAVNSWRGKLAFRQPIIRKITQDSIQEFAIGTSVARQESDESLLGFAFPVTEGADALGRTNSTVLSAFQEYSYRDPGDSIILRSQFDIGLPIATRNADLFSNGTFFILRGQALWAHQFSNSLLWVNRAGIQLADGPVIPSQQFSLGGSSNVRGYRESLITRDNGVFFSTELRIPLFSGSAGTLQLVPFGDVGYAWNQEQRFFTESNQVLASLGIGLQYDLTNRISARLEYGIPLLNRQDPLSNLQGRGLHLRFTASF